MPTNRKRTTAPPQRPQAARREKCYRIKPLVWKKHRQWAGWTAKIPWHSYEMHIGGTEITGDGTYMIMLPWGNDDVDHSTHASLQQAKAAAESWYRQQLRQALVEVKS